MQQIPTGSLLSIGQYTCFSAIPSNHPNFFLPDCVQKSVLYVCISLASSLCWHSQPLRMSLDHLSCLSPPILLFSCRGRGREERNAAQLSSKHMIPCRFSPLFNKLNSYTIWKEWGGEKQCFGLILIRSHKVSVAPLNNCPQFWGFRQNCKEQQL